MAHCSDGSDEMCDSSCVPQSFTGRFTLIVCSLLPVICYSCFLHKFKCLYSISQHLHRNVKKIPDYVSQLSGFVMDNWIALKAQMKIIVLVMSLPWSNVSQNGIPQFVYQMVGLGMDILIASILTHTTIQVKIIL